MPADLVPAPSIDPEKVPAIIPIRFWTEHKFDPADPSKPIEEDWVEWVKKGESHGGTVAEAIKRLMPRPELRRGPAVEWSVIEQHYLSWKKGNETPTHGTPLFSWSGVTREMAEALKKFNILTVEDLAEFPDHSINKVPIPSLREWRRRAKAFVEARELNDIGDQLATRDSRISAQEERMVEMAQMIDGLKADLAAATRTIGATQRADEAVPVRSSVPLDPDEPDYSNDPSVAPVRARRGRPRKDD